MDGSEQPNNSDGSWRFEPGDTVSPRSVEPAPTAVPSVSQVSLVEPEILHPTSVASPPTGPQGGISWTASEFIAHQKSIIWYVCLAVVAIVVAAAIWMLTHDTISATVVLVAAAALGGFGARKPRELPYRLDNAGLMIGQRHYGYEQFRSFSIVQEGAFASIVFMPLKRFATLTTIHYDPSDEPKILDLLSERLPTEDRQRDLVDRFMWHIRF